MNFVLSPRAQADIEEIWDYTYRHWGFAQAEHYIRQLQQSMESVAMAPAIGMQCEHIRTGYYSYPAGSHILFYRLASKNIEIVRILHERMDFKRHL